MGVVACSCGAVWKAELQGFRVHPFQHFGESGVLSLSYP